MWKHRVTSKCSKQTLRTAPKSTLSAPQTNHVLNDWSKHRNPALLLIKRNLKVLILLKKLPPKQSCLHLCQMTSYLNFNSSLGILHMFQSCINIQCHNQSWCKPQGIIRFTSRLNDICSGSMELLGQNDGQNKEVGKRRKQKTKCNYYCS